MASRSRSNWRRRAFRRWVQPGSWGRWRTASTCSLAASATPGRAIAPSARRWLIDHDVASAIECCAALGRFWYVRCRFDEGRRWLDEALARSEGMVSAARVEALATAGSLARDQGDYEYASARLEESVAM